MKNIRQEHGDSLRSEYRRTDFGEMARGKYANTQLEFPELVRLLLACIAEDAGLKFNCHRPGDYLTNHKRGDWTYELDNANQITLRYWRSEFENIEEPIAVPPRVTSPQERLALQNLLTTHVLALKNKVDAL